MNIHFFIQYPSKSRTPVTFVPIWRLTWTGHWSWTLRRTAITIPTKAVRVMASPSVRISSCTNSPTSMRGRVEEEEEVEDLGPGQHWKEGTLQDLVGVFWAPRTMGRVESLTADISTASAAAKPVNIVKPQRRMERVEGGDTGIRAGKEDLSVSI